MCARAELCMGDARRRAQIAPGTQLSGAGRGRKRASEQARGSSGGGGDNFLSASFCSRCERPLAGSLCSGSRPARAGEGASEADREQTAARARADRFNWRAAAAAAEQFPVGGGAACELLQAAGRWPAGRATPGHSPSHAHRACKPNTNIRLTGQPADWLAGRPAS